MEYPLKDFLRDLRTRRGYTQEYVASHIGVTRQAYSNYENGTTEPSISMIRTMIDLYDIDVKGIIMRGMGVENPEITQQALTTMQRSVLECFDKVPPAVKQEILEFCLFKVNRCNNEKKRKH